MTEQIMDINKAIVSAALRGSTDSMGWIDISWKKADHYHYLFVFIEDCYGSQWYRIFACRDDYKYERNRILDPSDSAEGLKFLYGYYENINENSHKLEKWEKGNWEEEIKTIVKQEAFAR